LQLTLDRIENSRMLVSECQRRVVAGEIEQLVAIHIEQPAAVPFLQDDRIRSVEERTARVGAGKIFAALQKVLVRDRGQATIEPLLSGQGSCFSSVHAVPLMVVGMSLI
jgi:hypothetical protein